MLFANSACSGLQTGLKYSCRRLQKETHMRFTTKAILVVASLVLAATASAQPRPGGGAPKAPGGGAPAPGGGAPGGLIVKIQAEQIAQLFNEAGFRSKVIDNNKIHMVQTEFWSDQVFSGAIPGGCEKDGSGCHWMQLFANLGTDSGVDQAWMDAWNGRWYGVRVHKLDNGAVVFYFDVPMLSGVTPDYIKAAGAVFKAIVDASTDFKP
jgi:hypothetical protein